ncbi:MAG: hypothetical protein IIY50_05395 [Mogibacterium sp.]|nr:hypothetical protein [Mogibacterium sp.]
MRNKKNSALIIMILALALAVFCVASMIIHKIAANDELEEAKRAAEEAEQAQEEEESREQAKLDRIAEEKSQWYLLLVNEWNAMPDDFDIETAEVEGGYEVDARVKDALKEMLSDCREAGYSPQIIS